MSYSANFTAGKEGKVKLTSKKQEVYHACRDLQKSKKLKLKAPTIRPEYTKYNQTYMYQGGRWVKPNSIEQVFKEIDKRYSGLVGRKTKKGYSKVRSDAVAVREMVLSIGNSDNDFYKKYGDNLQAMAQDESFKDIQDWAVKNYGKHILYFSIHVDEGKGDSHHAHVHMGLDTIFENSEGKKTLNQKKLKGFDKPQSMRELHKDFYSYLQSKGLDVALTPGKTAITRKRLSQKDYNELQDLKEEQRKLQEEKRALQEKASEMATLTQQLKVALDRLSKSKSDFEKGARRACYYVVRHYAKHFIHPDYMREEKEFWRDDEGQQLLQDIRRESTSTPVKPTHQLLNQADMLIHDPLLELHNKQREEEDGNNFKY